jgi:hypothetical protein
MTDTTRVLLPDRTVLTLNGLFLVYLPAHALRKQPWKISLGCFVMGFPKKILILCHNVEAIIRQARQRTDPLFHLRRIT